MCTIKFIGNNNNNYCFGAFDVPDMMPHAYNPKFKMPRQEDHTLSEHGPRNGVLQEEF